MPKVKICGITNYEDAALALDLGAGMLGFVFAPSPRRVEPEVAGSILKRLRAEGRLGKALTVGVFVNAGTAEMTAILEAAGLDMAQIHGDEEPAACASFGFPWYRALRIGSAPDARRLVEPQGRPWTCQRLLFDAVAASAYGGTGTTLDREAALEARRLARASGKEFFIAGGIRPGNVASILRSLDPDGIDVSSGVEERPGKKSKAALEELFRAIATVHDGQGREHATR